MKRILSVAAITVAAGLTLSACGIAETASDTTSSHAPSNMTRENKGTTKKGG